LHGAERGLVPDRILVEVQHLPAGHAADAGGPGEALASADALRTAALTLDELLPAYQPS
jgi:hypothetical protein